MARFQSNHARGILQVPEPLSAGAICSVRFDFVFSTAFAFAADQIEMGILPAFATITAAILIGAAGGANTANVGLMGGTIGDLVAANGSRVVGTELFAATSVNAVATRNSTVASFNIAPSPTPRAIGVELTANVAASANSISLILQYTM